MHRSESWPARVAFALLFLLVAGVGEASTVIFRSDAELIALSDRIVHGRVIRQRTERPDGPDGAIYTVTTLAVLEDFTGADDAEVDVWELGGAYGGEIMWVGGAVMYEPGSTVLVCLERGRFGLRSVAMGFSKFDVVAGQMVRNDRGVSIVGAPAIRKRELTLDQFRGLAAQIRGVAARVNSDVEFADVEAGGFAAFTFLGAGFRWTEADANVPVKWYINTAFPCPLLSGNCVPDTQLALSAWTAPASATITLQYVGTTNQAVAKGPWSGIGTTGSGVITFEDPNNEISGSTLAIGGGFGTSGGGTVNGMTFLKFTRAYVIWANVADLGSSFRQSPNFSRVMEHEIGHTIGLGHSDQSTANIMYPSCCSADTPTTPALGPDDLAGLNFIYPSGSPTPPPPACTYSINPTSTSISAGGGTSSLAVNAPSGCTWTAAVSTGSGFLSITNGSSGNGNGTVNYSVGVNATTSPRTGTLTIAGLTFTLTQAAAACGYTLSASSATVPASGGARTVTVTTSANCSWTATTLDAFLTVASGSSGTGSGTVSYNVLPNSSANYRVGTITIAGQPFVVTETGTGPAMSIDKPSLYFGASTNGAALVAQTTAQAVRLSQAGSGTVTWTASSNVPWLSVSPASGTGPATLNVSVGFVSGLPGAGTIAGAISLTFNGAGAPVGPIASTLTLYQPAVPGPATGAVDSPANNLSGVSGSIGVTGWALDDIEVVRVRLLRDPVAGEGAGLVAIGTATFVDGARTDVAGLFATTPRQTRAGWGYLMLTNFLPNLGNGTFRIHAYADDADGHTTLLGSRTITCVNSAAVAPFGAIDVPDQGAVVSGVINNFGWVLTHGPSLAYPPFGTVRVLVDGIDVGSPSGWTSRDDLSALFPAATYPGITNALGVLPIDTTRLTNGLHTIAWVVTANDGQAAGIGSRFFTVQNASGPITAAPDDAVVAPATAPEVAIDAPIASATFDAPASVRIAGWAIDPVAAKGTGINAIHVWAYPAGGGAPAFLGAASYGISRPDVAAYFGDRYRDSGFSLNVDALPPGAYDIAVFAWSTVSQGFAPAKVVRIVMR